ncbi:MAG: apolipoprotein N-acyltransferase [Spirochaetales bacterium]|nr:apolipoprotein N-acyltransferase [Spirochaetales bacterium]
MTVFGSQLKDRQKILLYPLLGVIWSLSNVGYIKFFGSIFAWFTFAPVIFFLKSEKTYDGIKYSAIFGFTAYLAHFWWMIVPITGMSKTFGLPEWSIPLSFLLALIILFGLSFLAGLNYTLCYAAANFLGKNKSFLFYFGFAVSGTVFDYFYPKLWADYLGYSQYQTVNIIQSVDLFGISYVTFLIMIANSFLAYFAETVSRCLQSEKRPENIFNKHTVIYGAAVFSLIIITAVYGSARFDFVSRKMKAAKKVSIGIVQGNISGAEKKSMTSSEMITVYNELSSELSNEHPELIVWPESAIPIWFNESQTDFFRVRSRFPGDSLLLFGGHARRDNGPGVPTDIFNSLFLIDSNGEKIESYYKNKLLPFTERAPVRFLSFIFPIMGLKEFSQGEGPRFIEYEDFKIAVNICYEAIIPEYIRKSIFNEKGESANLIINCTNDSWFGRTIEPEMHLRIATIRAIENRRCLIRSTCTGYSVVTDANGCINYRSHLLKPESHAEKIPLLEIKSFYTSYGWFFIYLLGIIFACWIAVTACCRLCFYLKFTRHEKYDNYMKRRRDIWMR